MAEKTVFKKDQVSCFYAFHSYNDAGTFDDREEFEQFKHEMEKKKVAFRSGQFGNPVLARQFANYGMATGMRERVIKGPCFRRTRGQEILLTHLHMIQYRAREDAAIDFYVHFGKEKHHPRNFIDRFDDIRNQVVGELKCVFATLDFIYRSNELDRKQPVALMTTSPFLGKLFAKGPLKYWKELLRAEGAAIGTRLAKEAGKYVVQLQERFWERCNLCVVYQKPDYSALPKENILGGAAEKVTITEG